MSSILIRRANVVCGKPSRLPAGYTELAYLRTDGSAYINTGRKITQVDKLVGRVSFVSVGSGSKYVAGCF